MCQLQVTSFSVEYKFQIVTSKELWLYIFREKNCQVSSMQFIGSPFTTAKKIMNEWSWLLFLNLDI